MYAVEEGNVKLKSEPAFTEGAAFDVVVDEEVEVDPTTTFT